MWDLTEGVEEEVESVDTVLLLLNKGSSTDFKYYEFIYDPI